ncbi:golvesin C-terminal-like domain-containing protein [Prevotella sp. 885]|uniref:golvesin C-terminal-like domain-containing protein n=1 Tax=Prevotella sp. 885 TaxID=2022527 RepID=UPI000BA0E62C|nr:xanthan lyase [Prevotella sp. 885]OZT03201.1 xanthan lyase [Prevotella sp. 885]
MVRNILVALFLASSSLATSVCAANRNTQARDNLGNILKTYVLQNRAKKVIFPSQPYLVSYNLDDRRRTLNVQLSPSFAAQDFTASSVRFYYKRLAKALPRPYNKYKLTIMAGGLPIEQLVAGSKCEKGMPNAWGKTEYEGAPWVMNDSRPYFVSHGLFDRHLSLWASHGRYYDGKKDRWKWQRPNLFGTTEDLFTQTIVIPYLIPMLENAGAVVFTPRERDWQKNEVIVDNGGRGYVEDSGKETWKTAQEKGFAYHAGTYRDGENPFTQGTARAVKATKKADVSWASYQPNIPQGGKYAVYVSYQSLKNSVSDAQYIVMHKGQRTVFKVNQQMGGGTWVYLGTFDFDRGNNEFNRVVVTNSSSESGMVTTDAVRFGGGIGNIERGGSCSGMPRCLEGARYSAQWAGAPYSVYSSKNGSDDYGDDINVRSNMTNWLAGGSTYVPTLEGKKVPIELSLAVHSDAGYTTVNDSIIGSLAICTTSFNDGRLNSGVSRMVSHDFADSLLTGLQRDISGKYRKWTRRYLWDRNYSETRKPEVPSAIIETMSHQNFADMRRGLDPNFRFTLARSLYKTILRFVNGNHSVPSVVQPLPVSNFRIERNSSGGLRLSWIAEKDEQEPTAVPTSYIVYTSEDGMGFDNGTVVYTSSFDFEAKKGVNYCFKVTALNRGGESFPSETLAAYLSKSAHAKDILVVDGFSRLSGPAVVDDYSRQGFDLGSDIGVSYGVTAGWNGRQQCFDKSRAGSEGEGSLGYCGDELAGRFIMGNNRDGSVCHVKDIAMSGAYNVVGCSLEALDNNLVKLDHYSLVDIAFGLQRNDGHSLVVYKTFSETLQSKLRSYVKSGGRILVSGAYVGSDMTQPHEKSFMSDVLKTTFTGTDTNAGNNMVDGLGLSFDIIRQINDRHFAATSVDRIAACDGRSFAAMRYHDGSTAGVAYDGTDYKSFVMGYPYECINNVRTRQQVMKGLLGFLLK